MGWAKLDDGFADHPKIVGLSDAAFRLHVMAICYAARHETDGLIPATAPWVRIARRAMLELVAVGLWDQEPAFTIHDYLEYNPSRSEMASRRDSKAMAGAKGAASRWHVRKNAPDPTRPVPISPPPAVVEPRGDSHRCVLAYDGLMGSAATTPIVLRQIDDWLDSMQDTAYDGPAWFEAACEEAAGSNGRSLKYVLSILKRWQKEGFQADTREKHGRENGGTAAFVSAFAGDIETP